jgi:sterol 3beta-glucosyltransferase
LALADGLQKAGHQVTLVVSSIDNQNYAAICQQLEIYYRQIPEHINFDMEGFAQRSFKMNPLQWLRALLDEAFFPNEQVIFDVAIANPLLPTFSFPNLGRYLNPISWKLLDLVFNRECLFYW